MGGEKKMWTHLVAEKKEIHLGIDITLMLREEDGPLPMSARL